MFKKGYKVSEETRQKMIAARAKHVPHMVGRYGITEEFARAEIAAGKSWCSDCKQFREREKFGDEKRRIRCRDCGRKRDKERHDRNPEYENARRSAHYYANLKAESKRKKDWHLSRYGANYAWYAKKYAEQHEGCAICGATNPDSRSSFMYVDHLHNAGCCKPGRACDKCRRGLLCSRCNNALERLDSITDWAEKALAYLGRYA